MNAPCTLLCTRYSCTRNSWNQLEVVWKLSIYVSTWEWTHIYMWLYYRNLKQGIALHSPYPSAIRRCMIWKGPGETVSKRQMLPVLLLFPPSPNVGIQNFSMWGKYNLAKASNGHTKDTTRLFHCPWHDPVGEHISVQPFRMWNTLRFWNFSQLFQRCKSDANKQDFENKPNLTCQALSTPKTIGILTHWGRYQIDAISQTTFSNAFSRMKMNGFRLVFQWSLFRRLELIIF